VVGLKVVPGAQEMYDLTVSNVHTFAVGAGQWVVHNCSTALPEGNPPSGWTHQDAGTNTLGEPISYFDHLDEEGNKIEVNLNHATKDMGIAWIDKLDNVKTAVPDLVNWLGDRVQTISGTASDGLEAKLRKSGPAAVYRMLRAPLTEAGFQGTFEQIDGVYRFVYRR
jgi:hypothetical protein